jgi:hypothetical protein
MRIRLHSLVWKQTFAECTMSSSVKDVSLVRRFKLSSTVRLCSAFFCRILCSSGGAELAVCRRVCASACCHVDWPALGTDLAEPEFAFGLSQRFLWAKSWYVRRVVQSMHIHALQSQKGANPCQTQWHSFFYLLFSECWSPQMSWMIFSITVTLRLRVRALLAKCPSAIAWWVLKFTWERQACHSWPCTLNIIEPFTSYRMTLWRFLTFFWCV